MAGRRGQGERDIDRQSEAKMRRQSIDAAPVPRSHHWDREVFQGISGFTAWNGIDSQERKHCDWRSGKRDDGEKGREQAKQRSSGYEKTSLGCGLFQGIPGIAGRNSLD